VAAGLACLVVTALVLPFVHHQLGPAASFLPALLAVVAVVDVLSVFLLVGEFHDSGDRRVLVMSCAYVWSLGAMLAYACAFPGVVAASPPLARTASMAPWFYVLWHGSFPILLGAAWAPWPARWTGPVAASARRRSWLLAVFAAAACSAAVVTAMTLSARSLPVLIHGVDTSAMTRLTAPVTLPLTLVALALAWRGTRDVRGPERWAPVVVQVCLADLVLTYTARTRYSVGWYAGRTLTLAAAAVVVLATIHALRRAKSQAQLDALLDPLTGLANRRSADQALTILLAGAYRSGTPLSVLALDIDHFKRVNDEHGHAAGDAVLRGIGAYLCSQVRRSDLAARVGGEELLLVLPGSDQEEALALAERIRRDVAHLPLPVQVTLSTGVATSHPMDHSADELLARADGALYEAKRQGRDRVVVASCSPTTVASRVPVPR
jgi:diguanylate cyclase (GGDEF)-like protein